MKIYRFDKENGYYLGEDFADEALLKGDASIVPPDATPLAPPRHGPGQIAVFDVRAGQWMLRERPSSAEQPRCARLKDNNETEAVS